MTHGTMDPLARASTTPDVSALIDEFADAQQRGPAQADELAAAEDVRYNRWPGKDPLRSGAMYQRHARQGTVVRPYDGRPDTDMNLADEIVGTEVDLDMAAFEMAQMGTRTTHTTPLTAAQSAELNAVGRWIRTVTDGDTADGAELLAQMKATLGWCVLNPGWTERYGLVNREVTLELLEQLNANLPLILADPALEEQAVLVLRELFPHLRKSKARAAARSLRETGAATVLDRHLEEKRPSIRVLIPGYNFFVSGGNGSLQRARGTLRVEFFYQAELEAMAGEGWNEEFIEAAIKTAGQLSAYGDQLKDNADFHDANDRRIEIWTSEVRQFDEETGAAGIYCTTFSPHVRPGQDGTKEEHYARHYLLDYAHGQYPYVAARREVTGPALNDSRGVPDMVRSDQKVLKKHQDALAARAELETNPPRVKLGSGWSKVKDEFGPGAEFTPSPGAEIKYLETPRGNPAISTAVMDRVENGTRRRFALPNTADGSHPAVWQARQMRMSKRWLECWEEAFWQLAVLTYQNLTVEELTELIGRPPVLTVADLLRHRISLSFDARAMDQDWTKTVLEFIGQLLQWDSGGLIDRAPILQVGLNYIDPAIAQNALQQPAGAASRIYREVEEDVASIMDMNPPRLRENDASAGMRLQFAQAVLSKNPKYQQFLAQSPEIQEHLKTYVKNLQHNVQETQISPVQGRLGVGAMPEQPVVSG